jgi:hypothetical protein
MLAGPVLPALRKLMQFPAFESVVIMELYKVTGASIVVAIVSPPAMQFGPLHDAELLLNVLLFSMKLEPLPCKNNAPPPETQLSSAQCVLFSKNVEFVTVNELSSPKIPIAPANVDPIEPVTLLLLNVHLFISRFPSSPENSIAPESGE